MPEDSRAEDQPCYVISVAARMVGVHAQTLRYYERAGLLSPSRSRGRIRLYSQSEIERLRQIQRLINDLGVNLAGAEVILRLTERLQQREAEMEELRRELQRLRNRMLPEARE
ncbi:MAG TPA: MerR family transcriptional regulator [Dehalococcoidia bacterium]|nr:MerR family transcriptional regulator [Dehalococcoidia bacterium]